MNVEYAIAYDHEADDPNPHAWYVSYETFPSFEEAMKGIDEEIRQQTEVEGYDIEEVPPMRVVILPGGSDREWRARATRWLKSALERNQIVHEHDRAVARSLVGSEES